MFEYLREINYLTIIIRVVLALLIGGIIGIDREKKSQPAGFRTYMLVCLGAALVMMTNQYLVDRLGGGDPSRLGAQVISGIGFLGAGSIIVTRKSRVRGLTTAAGLWTAACTGLAVGIGFYEGAILSGLAIFLIMGLFRKIDKLLLKKATRLRLYINFSNNENVMEFLKYCKLNEYKIIDLQIADAGIEDVGIISMLIILEFKKNLLHEEILREIEEKKYVLTVEEI